MVVNLRDFIDIYLRFACILGLAFEAQAQRIIPQPMEQNLSTDKILEISTAGAIQVNCPDPFFIELLNSIDRLDFQQSDSKQATISFLPFGKIAAEQIPASDEGYILRITESQIISHAATRSAHFNALQSIRQMLEQASFAEDKIILKQGFIRDAPRFAWRGFMLDESRHFSGEVAVKRHLDAMARYKLNRFHWHLTDSPGWRIEIKKYPKLTEIGARGSESDRSGDGPAEFYTQEQIRDIVAYAKQRNIVVIPEIDMPGHADAAIRAYPEHDGGGYKKWDKFTFNPAKPETLAFLEDILRETAELFPDAGVIHFGGDEVHFGWGQWPELDEVKALMANEPLEGLREVESWFNHRMANFINELGFKTGGWDEIANKGLPTDQTLVFWWRHDKRKVLDEALQNGYPTVLCPRRPLYFDFVQHDSHKTGRRWNGICTLEDVHNFPDSLNLEPALFENVVGIQANMWTETMITQERRDFMAWPRSIALGEAAWSATERKDLDSFKQQLPNEIEWLKAHNIQAWDPFAMSPEVPR